MRKAWRWFILLMVAIGVLAACGRSEGEDLLEQRCTGCHEKPEVVAVGRTRSEWSRKVDQMIVFGAELTEEEKGILIKYLTETYGP